MRADKRAKLTPEQLARHRASSAAYERRRKARRRAEARAGGFLTYQEILKLRRKDENRALLAKMKNSPCLDCGRMYHPAAMDFDHVDPASKKYAISTLCSKGGSLRLLLAEVMKCELVCANCHRIREYNRRQSLRSP